MKVLLIIPAYNEEKSLPRLIYEIRRTCPQYDALVINDCSKDGTAEFCRSNNVDYIDLPINLGIGGAVQAGYKYAFYNGYDVAIQLDGDGQHNPAYIEALLEEIKKGANMCIGSRFITKEGFQSTVARRVGIAFFSRLIKLISKQHITDTTSGFRACDRKTIAYFSKEYPRDYPEPETIMALLRNNCKISEVPVIMNERDGGESSIKSLKTIYYMIKVSIAVIMASLSRRGIA